MSVFDTYQGIVKAAIFKSKWETADWTKDEDAAQDFYDANRGWGERWDVERANKEYNKNDAKAVDAFNKFNIYQRNLRNSDESAKLIDRYIKLMNSEPIIRNNSYQPAMNRLYKMDRADSLNVMWGNLEDNYRFFSKKKQQEAAKLYDEIGKYFDALQHKSDKVLKEPITRKDVGSLADASPKQIERWKSESKQSPAWAGFWPTATGVLSGAALGGLFPLKEETELSKLLYRPKQEQAPGYETRARIGSSVLGSIFGGLVGGYAGFRNYKRTKEQKEHAENRLNEK